MKREKFSQFVTSSLLSLILLSASFWPANLDKVFAAGLPTIFTYQGRLADSGGNLLGSSSGTTYFFKFSIWDSPTVSAGSKVWPASPPTSVAETVRSGVFTVNIGDVANGYPDALDYAFNNPNVYLQVEVSSDNASFETLSPRQQMTSAIFAQVAGSLVSASSTATNFTSSNSTTTNATSTNLFVSGLASTTSLRANTGIIGFLNTATLMVSSLGGFGTRCLQTDNNGLLSVAASACGSGSGGSSGGTFSTTTSQVAGQFINYPNNDTDILTVGAFSTTTAPIYFDPNTSLTKIYNQYFGTSSTTLQNFTFRNATGTNATTTSFFATTASTTNLFANIFNAGNVNVGAFLVNGSSTLQNFTATNATTSQATTTSLAITGITSKLLKTLANGAVVGATPGVDYQAAGSYLTSAVTSLAQSFGSSQTGAVTLATSTQSFNGLTLGNSITNSGGTFTFTPSVTGTLGVGGGGTGLNTLSANQLLIGGAGNTLTQVGTSSLGLPTFDGSNTFTGANVFSQIITGSVTGNAGTVTNGVYTNTFSGFFDSALAATTTLNNLTTLKGLTDVIATRATTTQATTTNFATATLCLSGDCRVSWPTTSGGLAFPFKTLGTGENATGTTLEFQNGFVSTASSTFLGPIRVSSITTNLSSTAGLTLGASDTPQILTIDTINNRVQTGIGSGSAAPSLFVLDTKNTSGDPAGVNGAMYYNSNTNTFRCYQDSAWQTCGGQATSTITFTELASSTDIFSANAHIGSLTANQITSGLINGQTISGAASFTGSLDVTSGITTLLNLLLTGSSTLQNFTAQNSTTTNATTTSLAATTFCLSGDCRTAWPTSSVGSFAFPFTKLATGEQATSTTLEFNNGFVSTASSTLTNFSANNATTTNATSTNFAATTICLSGDCRSAWPVASAGGFSFPFKTLGTGENATGTTLEFQNRFGSTASSTLATFTATNSTSTNATTTSLAISSITSKLLKTDANGSVIGATAGTDYQAPISATFPILFNSNTISLGFGTTTNNSWSGEQTFLASTTLQRFTATHSTTTNATTTNLATGTFCLNGDCRTAWPTASTFAFPFSSFSDFGVHNATTSLVGLRAGFYSLASSTIGNNTTGSGLTINGGATSTGDFLHLGSTTLQNFTAKNATTSQATTTGLAITGVTSKILYAFPDGDVGALTVGTGLTLTNGTLTNTSQSTFAFPFKSLGTGENATSTTLEFQNGFVSTASSTLATFTATNATTSQATTTNLAVTGLTSKILYAFPDGDIGALTVGTGLSLTNGTLTNSSQNTFTFPFGSFSDFGVHNATTSLIGLRAGFYALASSTIGNNTTGSGLTINGGATSTGDFLHLGSTTLQKFTANQSTTSQATSTNLAITGVTSKILYAFPDGDVGALIVGTGLSLTNGTLTNSSQNTFAYPFTSFSDFGVHNATTSLIGLRGGFYSLASSTIGNNTAGSGLTINGGATTTGQLLALGSTTLQNFVATNSTTTNATSTTLASGTICLNSDCRTVWPAASTFAFPFSNFTDFGTHNATTTLIGFRAGFYSLASSTIGNNSAGSGLTINGGATTTGQSLHLASTTLQNFTAQNGTTSQATTTNLAISGVTSKILYAFPDGDVGALTVGTGLSLTNGTLTNSSQNTFAFPFSNFTDFGVHNATTSLIGLRAGFYSLASSTIGNNTAGSGLTINGGATSTGDFLHLGSTTLQKFTANQATTSEATTTSLFVSGRASTTDLRANTASIGSLTVANCIGCSASSMTFSFPFTTLGTSENATSTTLVFQNGFVSTASSTLTTFTATNATTSQATTTNLAVTGVTSKVLYAFPDGDIGALTIGTGLSLTNGTLTNNAQSTFAFPFSSFADFGVHNATTSLIGLRAGFYSLASSTIGNNSAGSGLTINGGATTTGQSLHLASTTLQNFTATNATTSQATSTNLAVTGVTSKILYAFPDGDIGALTVGTGLTLTNGTLTNSSQNTFAFPFKSLGTGENATSTTLEFQNGFVSTASSTLATFTATNATTSQATTTNLAISGVTSKILYAFPDGDVGALTVGTGLSLTNGTLTNSSQNTFAFPFSNFTDFGVHNATTSLIGLRAGFYSLASSTIGNNTAGSGLTINGGATSTGDFLHLGSTTLQNFTAKNATTSQATTTGLAITGITSKILYAFPDGDVGSLAVGTGLTLTNGTLTNSSQNTFAFPFTSFSDFGVHNATTSLIGFRNGLYSIASTTIGANTTGAGLTINGGATSTGDFLHLGSTTLQKFTANQGTTSQATTTNLAITGVTSKILYAFPDGDVGALTVGTGLTLTNGTLTNSSQNTFAFPFTSFSDFGVHNATTSLVGFRNGLYSIASTTIGANTTGSGLTINGGATSTGDFLHLGSTTLQNFTAKNATTSQATTTNLAVTGVTSKILYAFPDGDVGALTVGTGLSLTNGTLTNSSQNTFAFPFSNFTDFGVHNATTSLIGLRAGFYSLASSTIGNNTAGSGLTINGGATTTGQLLALGSTTLQSFTATSGTTTNATSTNLAATTFCLSNDCRTAWPTSGAGSFTFPFSNFTDFGAHNATTSLIGLRAGFYSLASSTIGNNSAGSGLTINGGATTTGQLLALGSTTLQAFTANQATTSEATTTNLYVSNRLAINQSSGLLTTALAIDGVAGTAGAEMSLNRANNSGTEANIDFNTAGVELWQIGLQNNNSNDFELWDGNDLPAFTINQPTRDVGIATTTPYARLTVWATSTLATSRAFEVVNSASTTLFTVFNDGSAYVNGSTTLQNFTATNATTTNATSTNLAATTFCLSSDCRTAWPVAGAGSFAYPFTSFSDFGVHNATTSLIGLRAGFYSLASSTIGNNTTGSGLTINGGATTTGDFLALGSTTLQNFISNNSTSTNATTTGVQHVGRLQFADTGANGKVWTIAEDSGNNLVIDYGVNTDVRITRNFYVNGSTTLQSFTAQFSTTTAATTTNLYATNFLVNSSSTFQAIVSTSATSTNEYTRNLLATASSTVQDLYALSFSIATSTTLAPFAINTNINTKYPYQLYIGSNAANASTSMVITSNGAVGFATTSPMAQFSIMTASSSPTNGSRQFVFSIGSSSPKQSNGFQGSPVTLYAIDTSGRVFASSTRPTLGAGTGACGTSPTIVGTDSAGLITITNTAAAKACVMTFARTWGNAPYCVVTASAVSGLSTVIPTSSTTATTMTIMAVSTTTAAVATAPPTIQNTKFYYYCQGDYE